MANKFKKGFVKEAELLKKEEVHQEQLRSKYNVEDPNIRIVEKNNWFKFFIKTISGGIRILAGIMLIILAGIGVFTLLNPSLRFVFLENIQTIGSEILL